jgi:CRISPR-associated endonuclease Cas3-HD
MSIAKSNGLSLDIHSKIVSEISSMLSNKIMLDNINIRFNETIKYASLLHDIGKLTTNFQKFLKGKLKKPNLKFRHNEIGWAIVSKYLSKDFNNRDIILNIIYWHQGI